MTWSKRQRARPPPARAHRRPPRRGVGTGLLPAGLQEMAVCVYYQAKAERDRGRSEASRQGMQLVAGGGGRPWPRPRAATWAGRAAPPGLPTGGPRQLRRRRAISTLASPMRRLARSTWRSSWYTTGSWTKGVTAAEAAVLVRAFVDAVLAARASRRR